MVLAIASLLVLVGLAGLLVSVSSVKNEEAQITVVANQFGTSPVRILPNSGWNWLEMLPFYEKVYDIIFSEEHFLNYTGWVFQVKVMEDKGAVGSVQVGLADIRSGKISMNYHLRFLPGSLTDQLTMYYKLVTDRRTRNLKGVEEKLVDALQTLLRLKFAATDLQAARSLAQTEIDLIRVDLQAECNRLHIPVEVSELKVNEPFDAVDPTVKESLAKTSSVILRRSADISAAELANEVATLAKIRARLEGEGEADALEAVAAAFGLQDLTGPQKAALLLEIKRMESWEKFATGKGTHTILLGGDHLMGQIKQLVEGFQQRSGGGQGGGHGGRRPNP